MCNNRDLQTLWCNHLPSKVNLLIWKLQHKRLATFDNLAKRGIIPETKPCPFCSLSPETEDRIFADCFMARNILREIADWWKLGQPPNSLEEILSWGELSNFSGENLQLFNAVIFTCLWQIWNSRNELVHEKKKDTIERMFLTINSRGKLRRKLVWGDWVYSPCSA
ncbi:hypothetical protein OSB04_021007, partial [Centaurea solstitialis]